MISIGADPPQAASTFGFGIGMFAGTRSRFWQCEHFTTWPRASNGIASTLRHLRCGHMIWAEGGVVVDGVDMAI